MRSAFISFATATFVFAVTGGDAHARWLLQNDGAEAGAQIGFYPSMQGDDAFAAILEVPPEVERYRVCRVFVWVGPDSFEVFSIRLGGADAQGNESQFIWYSDLTGYQIFGSRQQISAVDLAAERIETEARRLRILFQHVGGGPPTIAVDTDGITPQRNQMYVRLRAGFYSGFVEDAPEAARPPGDWVVRAEIVAIGAQCPVGDAPLPPRDSGVPGPDPVLPDADITPADATRPDASGDQDAGVAADARAADARPPSDARPRDAAPSPDARPTADIGLPGGRFAVERVVPDRGPTDRNTEVVINGRGFPVGAPVTVKIGEARLLEAVVLSESTLTGYVPAGLALGVYPLSVTRPDGQIAILPEAFTVEGEGPPLGLAAVTPRSVAEGTEASLTVSGNGMTPSTTFQVGGVPLIEVAVNDSGTVATGRLLPLLGPGTHDLEAADGPQRAQMVAAVTVVGADGLGGTPSGGCDCAISPAGRGWNASSLALGLVLLFAAPWARRRRQR